MRYALSGQFDRSIPLYERATAIAIRQYGDDSQVVADMYFNLGAVALEASEYQKAENALNQSVRINPSSVMARVKLAEILRLRGHPEAAQRQALAAVQKHRLAPEAQQELALCYLELGNLSRANEQFFNLSQVLSGIAPTAASSGLPSTYKHDNTNTSALEVLKAHPKQPALNVPLNSSNTSASISAAATAAAASQAMLQKAYEQLRLQKTSRLKATSGQRKARTHGGSSAGSGSDHHAGSHSKTHGGSLVPPPPDTVPTYPGVVPVGGGNAPPAELRAHAQLRKRASRHGQGEDKDTGTAQTSVQEPAQEEKASRSSPSASSSQDSDFLLDWASVKRKESK